MGALLSSLMSRCVALWSRWSQRSHRAGESNRQERLPDVEEGEGKANGAAPRIPKRRALLVGISYRRRLSKKWLPLDGTRDDVKRFQELLIHTYKFPPEGITILMDDPDLPETSQPTRVNMIRELEQLVSGAAPGDTFIFLYSGHSDQQLSYDDPSVEEDGQDEVIITCDLKRIIDNELNYILVKDLPVGCTLLAILDTCHSGTMLDLPHYHCNDVYVPWLSKGDRRTKSLHLRTVRNGAVDFVGFPNAATRRPSTIASVMSQLTDTPPGSPLRINTEVSHVSATSQREASLEARPHEVLSQRSGISFLSPTRYDSPVSSVGCSGWCGYEIVPHPTVLSLSACGDPQRAWEGPRGSLTVVLCEFLAKNPCPSYRTLMSHVNFQLHANCLALHNYTLKEKKKAARGEGPGFDGELSNFQAPQLSSLSRLRMDDILRL
ncbi:caspase domain-containing protein [Russula dissimulans]|nr:caspase domain-containing protein [Russula dissimulans]